MINGNPFYYEPYNVNWVALETAKPFGPEAHRTKMRLLKLLKANSAKIAFEPGETVIFNNKEVVHAREPQTEAFRTEFPEYYSLREEAKSRSEKDRNEMLDKLSPHNVHESQQFGYATQQTANLLAAIQLQDRFDNIDYSEAFCRAVQKVTDGRLFSRYFVEIDSSKLGRKK